MVEISNLFGCPGCGAPVCQRAYAINLAVGMAEDQYCLLCLAQEFGQSPEEMLEAGYHYVSSRECFRKAWDKQASDPDSCPRQRECVVETCFGA
jgi:hypothetical protein